MVFPLEINQEIDHFISHFSVTRTYGEENHQELKKASHLHGLDESASNARLPYILNNLPPYTGPPSHSVLKKSNNHLIDLKRDYHLITTTTIKSPTTSSTLAPYIDPTTPTNVTVIRGKTAMLVCVVTDLGTAKVCLRTSKYCAQYMYIEIQRFFNY